MKDRQSPATRLVARAIHSPLWLIWQVLFLIVAIVGMFVRFVVGVAQSLWTEIDNECPRINL